MSFLFQAKSYLRHWLLEVDEHSIHSPFFFDFYKTVLKNKNSYQTFQKLEKLHSDLSFNQTIIEVEELNAGSPIVNKRKRTLSEIAHTTLSQKKYCELYLRIAQHLKAKKILELGTSLGLTSLYLSECEGVKVITFESSHSMANIALTNFEFFDKQNIKLIEGNLTNTLPDYLQETEKINLVLMAANLYYEPTLKYFNLLMRRVTEKSIIAVNGIHQSQEMERAWKWIQQNKLVYGTIDLFHCGIVFFEPSLNNQHFIFTLPKN